MSLPALPLSKYKVIDLSIARAGPTAVRQLADWGADVIRIEAPGTNDGVTGTPRHGPDFQNLHRNKRCITLNLKSEEGRELLLRLAEDADVMVENFRPDVKRRLRIDYDSVRARNPLIVYGSISGFGQDGPYRDRPGVDQIAQGLGGLMSITGLPGQGPVRVGIPISDLAAGMYLAIGILVALLERQDSGEGQWVHTSLLEAQIAMLDFQAARWLIDREVPSQAGNHHPTGIPMGVFPTADGHINIAAPGNRMFRIFCRAIGAEALLERPEYADAAQRSRNREELNTEIGEYTSRRKGDEWIALLNDAGIPCGPINTIDETFADPQVRHLGIATPVEHKTLGKMEIVGQPVHLTRTPQQMRSAAPEHGEHTDDVLATLGYDEGAIADLRTRGII